MSSLDDLRGTSCVGGQGRRSRRAGPSPRGLPSATRRASADELRRPSNGTRWTNRQLLFHMLLGYLIIRALLTLVRVFGRLPAGVSRAHARLLNKATRPFDVVNYAGSALGGTFLTPQRMGVMFDRVIAALHRRPRPRHYPTRWDPFFQDFMTLADVYRFPTQHFNFHRDQLTLTR